jgi:hypothetical protein
MSRSYTSSRPQAPPWRVARLLYFLHPHKHAVPSNTRQHRTLQDKDHFVDDVWKQALDYRKV